jgi:Trm5-related predicted tRNA methylase
LKSYFSVDSYFPITLLTKENEFPIENKILESIETVSEYYFDSIMVVIDG